MNNLPNNALPLKIGDSGIIVDDLHRLLTEAQFPAESNEGHFTTITTKAVRAFQKSRHLETTGICDLTTWFALIEAGYRLGDRLLYLQSPMLRGDDIADLQNKLGTLGFDSGRVDGIFGPNTEIAVRDFQRNAGLPIDAIFGPDSLHMLTRLGNLDSGLTVVTVREKESLITRNIDLDQRQVIIGEEGGLGSIVNSFFREFTNHHIKAETISHSDMTQHAQLCNTLEVDLYIGIVSSPTPSQSISFFSNQRYESPGGAYLSKLLHERFVPILGQSLEIHGRADQVLRETRMPAVVIRIGPANELTRHTPSLAKATANAVIAWLTEPLKEEDYS